MQTANLELRCLNIINKTIEDLNIDLSSKTVITEVGSNLFLYSPLICLLSKAAKVYAWTSDSKYGSAEVIAKQCKDLCQKLGYSNIEFAINEKPSSHLKEADIITNSGFIRPINYELLQHCKSKNLVIPLMYEKWEFRDTDIELEYCKKNNIKVAGTWENHPKLKIFDHVQGLALKMAFNAGYEVRGNNIVIWSNDSFGEKAKESFLNNGAARVVITNQVNELIDHIPDADFIFMCNYNDQRTLFSDSSKNGLISFDSLFKLNPHISLIHLYGSINYTNATSHGLNIYPKYDGRQKVMSLSLAEIGCAPALKLICAGMKVAELLSKNIEDPLAQVL